MSELIDVVLPPDQVEGTRSQVQRWLKAVGEPARRHEPLVEIETDKVTVEVPSPADGVLAEIVVAEGVDVEPGAVLARLRAASAADGRDGGRAGARGARRRIPSAARAAGTAGSRCLEPGHTPIAGRTRSRAGQVTGSGEGGRITVEDVLAAAVPRPPCTGRDAAPRSQPSPPKPVCAPCRIRRCAGASRRTWSRASCIRRRT